MVETSGLRQAREAAAILAWRLHESARGVIRERRRALVPGDTPIRIDELVSPLRYDIVVRVRYLEFLVEHLDLYSDDFDAYVQLARRQPYYVWFETLVVPRLRSGRFRGRPPSPDVAFRDRIRRTTKLYRDFCVRGFDARRPVSVRRCTQIVTATGKVLQPRHYPVDGCHRIALLKLHGMTTLLPSWYQVMVETEAAPMDNTHVLLRALGLDESEYYEFLSSGYEQLPHDLRELLDADPCAEDGHPGREIRGLVAIDGPHLNRGR